MAGGESRYFLRITGHPPNFATGLPSSLGTVRRTTTNTYFNETAAATGCSSVVADSNGYWTHETPISSSSPLASPRNELQQSVMTDGTTTGTTSYTYDANGDVKTKIVYTNSAATTPLTTTYTYDGLGNLTSITDPNGGQTQYAHSDGCKAASYVSSITDPLGYVTQQTWDCTSGLIQTRTDPNGVETAFDGYDVWGRPTKIQEASGKSDQRTTTYTYTTANTSSASTLPISILKAEDLLASGDQLLKTTTQINQLGETYSTERGNVTTEHLSSLVGTDSSGSDSSTNSCSANSSGTFTYEADSNPFFTTSDATIGWVRKKYDQDARLVAVDHFAGSASPFPWGSNTSNSGSQSWCYSNNVTTFTDEAAHVRTQTVDGLGRLITVNENPSGLNYTTTYTYDFGDRLKTVTQTDTNEGSLTRTFVYDSAGRMTSATNPETGAINYTPDNNGNVTQRSDSRVTANFTYDLLNRVKTKTYTGASTPSVTYCYDALPTSPGTCATSGTSGFIHRLTEVYSSSSEDDYLTFDDFGRVLSSQQITGSVSPGIFKYTYTPQGSLLTETYPSGRAVTYTLDNVDGRVTTVADASITYAKNIAYWAHGAIEQMQRGDSLFEGWTYNDRLQPTLITLGPASGSSTVASFALTYCSSGTVCATNNGNVLTQVIEPLGPTDTYTYDGVNRIAGATETNSSGTTIWTQPFAYDAFGNRAVVSSPGAYIPNTGFTPQVASSTAALPYSSNRWTGATYDGSGNLSAVNSFTYTYDAENRQTQASQTVNSTTTTTNYSYDGDGRRVTKVAGSTTTTYVYDAQGHLTAEYASAAPTDSDCISCYLTTDHLGSTRVITDGNGNVVVRHDFVPFGEELSTTNRTTALEYGTTSTVTEKFTGKERDAETGLDFFHARYFSGPQGRFSSPDEPLTYADSENPQSWNLYAYVNNNPLALVDDDGHYGYCPTGTDATGMACNPPPSPLIRLIAVPIVQILQIPQQISNVVEHLANFNWQYPSCVAGKMGTWGAAGTAGGAAVGAIGVAAGGVGEVVTVPTGAVLGGGGGAIAGGVSGLVTCSSSSTDQGGGQSRSRTSANQMQKQVERGQAPKSVDRVDKGIGPFEKDHVEFKDGNALNYDGTWKHGGRAVSNVEKDWLQSNGWSTPK